MKRTTFRMYPLHPFRYLHFSRANAGDSPKRRTTIQTLPLISDEFIRRLRGVLP